jgi:hypothetical protein
MHFYTNPDANAGTGNVVVERMRIEPSGNVRMLGDITMPYRRWGYIFADLAPSGTTGDYTITVTGFPGEGSGSNPDMARFYYVTLLSTAGNHEIHAMALYTNSFNGTALHLQTFGKYEFGGTATFGGIGPNPHITVTNGSGNQAAYTVHVVSVN